MTFSDVECFFMKLMKGANEEDWNFLANFERDDYTRIYDHKIRSVYNAESLLALDVALHFDTLQQKAHPVWSLSSVCRQSKKMSR